MELILSFSAALLLGLRHAFDTDHVAAVTAFAAQRPRPRVAMRFGLRWALGHGGVLVVVGTVLVALGLHIPETSEHWFERLVGLSLVGLGAWTVVGARKLHAHAHTHHDGMSHTHLHSHAHGAAHDHGHAATVIGALHGLAGTGAVVGILPVLRFDSATFALGYLLFFALGTGAAMGLYALLAGWIAGRAAERSTQLARGVAVATGIATAIVGLLWLVA